MHSECILGNNNEEATQLVPNGVSSLNAQPDFLQVRLILIVLPKMKVS